MNKNTEIRTLSCVLSEKEQMELGKELATLERERIALQEEKKDSAKEYNKQLSSVEAKIKNLSKEIEEGKQEREVKCSWILNCPENGKKQLRRKDTGEMTGYPIYMSEEETQPSLPIEA